MVAFLGVVSAAEVTIGNEKFNIPDGFKENSNQSCVIQDSSGTTYIKAYDNADDEGIAINVIIDNSGTPELPDDMPGTVNKTIKGIDGIFNNDTNEFTYVHNDTMVTVCGPSEALLEEILVPF